MYEFQYPPNIHHFTKVMFATEPSAGQFQWVSGFVVAPKNQSCDIVVFRPDGVVDYRSDCWHADDPRCKASPEMYRQFGRGVFRLASDEFENGNLREDLGRLRSQHNDVVAKLRQLQSAHDKLKEEVAMINMPFDPPKLPPKPRKEALLSD